MADDLTPMGGSVFCFAFQESRLLVAADGSEPTVRIPSRHLLEQRAVTRIAERAIGRVAGCDCVAAEIPADHPVPRGMSLHGLRGLHGRLPERLFAMAGRARQIVEWLRTHRFCGYCGEPTVVHEHELTLGCPACGRLHHPRVSPAVIMLVRRGHAMLLARAHGFPEGVFSTLAGFVEPGETLEQAVAREVREEVGVRLRDIRYFGSQPWPFPHSLMIGFTAEYAGGELALDDREIADAAWFTADRLPRLPPRISIARRLIDSFVAEVDAPIPTHPRTRA